MTLTSKNLFKIRHKQQGMGLVTAIFVITAMSFLAVTVTSMVKSNAQTTEKEIELVRAFYAAESGLQLGLNALFPPPASGLAASCPLLTTYLAPFSAQGLNNCAVSLSCSGQTKTVASLNYYTLTSTGSCGDVSRTIQIRAQ